MIIIIDLVTRLARVLLMVLEETLQAEGMMLIPIDQIADTIGLGHLLTVVLTTLIRLDLDQITVPITDLTLNVQLIEVVA